AVAARPQNRNRSTISVTESTLSAASGHITHPPVEKRFCALSRRACMQPASYREGPMMAPAPNSPAPARSDGVADPLSPLIPRIEQALASALDRMTGAARMIEACRYAVQGGGKRVRPALVLLSYQAAGGAARCQGPAEVAAVAVEFVHTFSLVHDDLPCMDDDDLRRGRPTLHVAMGECAA